MNSEIDDVGWCGIGASLKKRPRSVDVAACRKTIMTERSALAIAAITALAWGLTGIFVRLLPGISPLAITAVRMLIALVSLLPILGYSGASGRISVGLTAALRRPAAYLLALLMVGYYLLATTAFQRTPVAEVALLISTQPLFVLAIRAFRRDNPALREIGGALLAIVGMLVILAPRLTDELAAAQHFSGSMMALGAAALSALYAYIYRFLSERQRAPESSSVSLLTFALGSAILLVALLLAKLPPDLSIPSPVDLALLLGLGIVSTAIPTIGFSMASRALPAIVTATISLLVPLFSGLFGYIVLAEGLSPTFIAGCIPVFVGVAMIIRRRRM